MRNLSLSLLFIIVLVTRLFSLPANTTVFLARHHPDKVIIIIRDFFLWTESGSLWVNDDIDLPGCLCWGGGGGGMLSVEGEDVMEGVAVSERWPRWYTSLPWAEISWLVNVTNGGLWLVSTWSRGSGWELMSLSTFLCQSSFIILVIMTSHLVTSEHGGHGAVRVPDHPILGETSEPHLPRPWVSVLWSLHKWKIRNGLVLWKYW